MARSPLSTPSMPPLSRPSVMSSQRVLALALPVLLLLSALCLPLTSAASITFLANQPVNHTTIPANRSSISITLLYPYANTTLLVTSNATALSATPPGASTPTITQLPASESASFLPYTNTTVLLLPVTIDPSSDYQSFYTQCRNSLLANPLIPLGYCNVTLTFYASSGSTVAYSVYSMPEISLNMAYTSKLAANSWHYYALWITYAQLDVLFTLTPTFVTGGSANPDVDLWLSETSELTSPLVPIFPTNPDGSYAYTHTGGQEVVELTAEGGWQDALYIVGVYAPATTYGVSGYTLALQGGVADMSSGGGGVEVSMFAIVGALVVLVLCLFSAAALIARRRRSYIRDLHAFDASAAQLELMHRIQVRALADGRLMTVGQAASVYNGATESQIGRLPSHVYAEGEMSAEDAKCTICLEEYASGESMLKVLHCGHVYHEECINTWLHTRKHCPLCLQNVDNAHDVAKHDDSKPAAPTTMTTSAGSEDGVKIEASAAAASSSSAPAEAGSGRRRSSSERQEGAIALEMPNTHRVVQPRRGKSSEHSSGNLVLYNNNLPR